LEENRGVAVQELILAGDIGGTKTTLALFSIEGGKLTPRVKKIFLSKDYPDLESILREFMADKTASVGSTCFGVAGPVIDGKSKTPNLPWVLDVREISRSLGLESVVLINDLEATVYGVLTLNAEHVVVLNEGLPPLEGNMCLIAAGTGLGEAMIYWDGIRYHPSASEGGHVDFAPRTPTEIELLRYLTAHFGHVSYERVVSGPGLINIYNFLKDSGYFAEPSRLRGRFAERDPAAVIAEAALAGEVEICAKALDLFVSIYAAEAGNLALKAKAVRGVYVGGGIAPKILKKLEDGSFMRVFTDKGRFSDFLSNVPVRVVLNEEAALLGAAHYAAFKSERSRK
jgi:glucokinase